MYAAYLTALIKSLDFKNLDLLTVGTAMAAIAILGLVIFLNNRGSVTNKTFGELASAAMIWAVINYLSYQTNAYPNLTIWLLRLVLFSAAWFAYYLFKLTFVFPENEFVFTKRYKYYLIPAVVITSLFTLTPFVFLKIAKVSGAGGVSTADVQPGIIVFAALVFFLIFGSFYNLIKKTAIAKPAEKAKYGLVLAGTIITFSLIIAFNFIYPAFLANVRYIPLGGLFMLPFIGFTGYAIFKHKLFNVKNIITALFTFLLCVVTLVEVVFATDLPQMLLRVAIFFVSLMISVMLVRNTFEIEAANEKKAEFMSFASHELRMPITEIKNCADLFLEGGMGRLTPEIKDGVQKILVLANGALGQIAQYLNKAKMELGQFTYVIEPFDLGKTVSQAVDEVQVNAEQKGIFVTYKPVGDGVYDVKADESKVRQVIGNVLDNAIKYTKLGGVLVTITADKEHVVLKIADTGSGIPAEMMPYLFKKFSKDDKETSIMGSGLGLFLSKTFIDTMKGRIWAESQGEGHGAQFYVELPKALKKKRAAVTKANSKDAVKNEK